jgi:hypothetical protein
MVAIEFRDAMAGEGHSLARLESLNKVSPAGLLFELKVDTDDGEMRSARFS